MPSEHDAAPLDLIIVGGGINGAGIARDAAGRGLRVALFEQCDLAEHTSSRSTKLIHGGLRYLEYLEFRLVREALKEREILMAIAPHIIAPQSFVLPYFPGARPAWMIRLGLFLYDRLGGHSRLPCSRAIRLEGNALGAPLRPGLRKGFVYSDAWVDDARLVLLNARDAADRGAQICTRSRVMQAQRRGDVWQVRVQPQNGLPRDVTAKALVNAAGPWVEKVNGLASSRNDGAGIRLVKGSHIVVHKLFEGDQAYLLQNGDGRVLFAIPYQGAFTLIGTTDVAFEGDPSAVVIGAEETRYLCDAANNFFVHQIRPENVVWAYAGVRPLYDDKAKNASAVTRDYVLNLDLGKTGQAPLLTVYGGKITTYRRLAEHALEKLLPHIAMPRTSPWTDRIPLPGGDAAPDAVARRLTERHPYLAATVIARMAKAYGTAVLAIFANVRGIEDMGRAFGAGLTELEVRYLIDKEWARSADDVLWRRTKLGLHMSSAEQEDFRKWFAQYPDSPTAREEAGPQGL